MPLALSAHFQVFATFALWVRRVLLEVMGAAPFAIRKATQTKWVWMLASHARAKVRRQMGLEHISLIFVGHVAVYIDNGTYGIPSPWVCYRTTC